MIFAFKVVPLLSYLCGTTVAAWASIDSKAFGGTGSLAGGFGGSDGRGVGVQWPRFGAEFGNDQHQQRQVSVSLGIFCVRMF